MHSDASILLMIVIVTGLIFTYTNGFQDGSSVTASAIGCRALTPVQAVLLVAAFEFLGAIFGGSAVANTIHSITSLPDNQDMLPVLACGLTAAVCWNFTTARLGYPSSSTHALVGGVLGAVFAVRGDDSGIVWGHFGTLATASGMCKVLESLFFSPLTGFITGYVVYSIIISLFMRATSKLNKSLKQAQWLTLAALAFGHGANDTQKAMGVLMLGLAAAGYRYAEVPLWVRVVTGVMMVVGIISLAPGIIKRVGTGIYRLRPVHGFVIQASSGFVMIVSSLSGGPVSASQVTACSVMGAGAAERKKGVHWLIAKDMMIAWLLTIPGSALAATVMYFAIFRFL